MYSVILHLQFPISVSAVVLQRHHLHHLQLSVDEQVSQRMYIYLLQFFNHYIGDEQKMIEYWFPFLKKILLIIILKQHFISLF